MKRQIKNWTAQQLYKQRSSMTFPEYQREKQLWPNDKKSLLVDSMIKDIDIPKIYFNQVGANAFEVIDGQQRLWSIWDFFDDEFEYKNGHQGQLFSAMSEENRSLFENYTFQVVTFQKADEGYLRDLFVRLQLGLLLNTGERLNAARGKMKDLIFRKLAKHHFITHIGISERRFARETLCAQIAINFFFQKKLNRFARTRYEDLQAFFDEYQDPKAKDQEFFRSSATRIEAILDELEAAFGARAKLLKNRSYIISLFFLMEEQLGGAATLSAAQRKGFSAFALELWDRLAAEKRLGMDRGNRELYVFETMLSSAPGEEYQIQRRHMKLLNFYDYYKKHGSIQGD